jgi:hypothetical protein
MTLQIKDLIDAKDSFIGKRLQVCGRVVVKAPANSYLTANYESFEEGLFIWLDDDGEIGNKLNTTLPPYGGGNCIYDEQISVTGTVVESDSGLELHDLSDCVVTRDETEVVVT